MLLIGVSPGPVKHVFSIGIGFKIQGHNCSSETVVIRTNNNMVGLPASSPRGAMGLFEGHKKLMSHEWIISACQPVPGGRADFGDGFYELERKLSHSDCLCNYNTGCRQPVNSVAWHNFLS